MDVDGYEFEKCDGGAETDHVCQVRYCEDCSRRMFFIVIGDSEVFACAKCDLMVQWPRIRANQSALEVVTRSFFEGPKINPIP